MASITTEDTLQKLRPAPNPISRKTQEVIEGKITKAGMTLNDHIERIFLELVEDPEFARLLDAYHDSDAVEGSQRADDYRAAEMVREYAIKKNIAAVRSRNLETIKRCLHVVAKRYNVGRGQRRSRFTQPAAA